MERGPLKKYSRSQNEIDLREKLDKIWWHLIYDHELTKNNKISNQ